MKKTLIEVCRVFRIAKEFAYALWKMRKVKNGISIFGSARTSENNKYYIQAFWLAFQLSELGMDCVSGGGPGAMEAINRGAKCSGVGKNVGLNIDLPFEQDPNPYIETLITFRYFFIRKAMFVKNAKAIVVFPGGAGTNDELFEVITLIQTKKIKQVPVILVGKEFWHNFDNWMRYLVNEGMMSKEDLDIYKIVDSNEEVIEILNKNLTHSH